MKRFFLILFSFSVFAQEPPDTEIFLFDIISENDESLKFENGKNISNNEGYDNQPSFYSEDILLYSGTRHGQTDIAAIDLEDSRNFWVSNTEAGSEFSPKRIPGSTDVAAVRLDTTGLQLLYNYNMETGNSTVLLPDLVVGYFAFYNQNLLLTAVLADNQLDLVLNDLKQRISKTVVRNIGRSIHKVPETGSMSYTVVNDENKHDLYLFDLENVEPESFFLCTLPEGVSDYAWLDEDRILLGKGDHLYLYDIFGESEWVPIADLSEYNLDNISRIAINESGTKIALAAELLRK